jgi:hypothetical protein
MAEDMKFEKEIQDEDFIHIILPVPKDTVTVSVTAKMIQNGKLIEAKMDMTPENFRQLRQDFLDNVEDGDEYDGVWSLTEEGKEYVERLLRGSVE